MPVAVPLAEIIAELEDLDEPNDRLTYLIEIGRTLPPLPAADKNETCRVLGCQARVWLTASERPGQPAVLDFAAESDAAIVQGLIAVLLAAYSGKTPAEILAFPIDDLFRRLKLPALVPMRSNGLYSMVKRIQSHAEHAQAAAHQPAASLPVIPYKPLPISSPQPAELASPPPATSATIHTPLDVAAIRADFPILATMLAPSVPLVYLDNAASTQHPRQVIGAMVEAYEHYYSNVHRGGHRLAAESTVRYEAAREAIRGLVNARHTTEVVFNSGTTAAINLVARSYGDANLRAGDEILLTEMEHHSNIVPWQQLAERTGAIIRWVPIRDDFHLDLAAYRGLLNQRTKIVAVTAVSNVLGTINPVREIIAAAHAAGAVVLVDAAQAVPHEPIDVQAWDCDFLAFSGHKLLGPSGVGALYARDTLLDAMPPFLGGGSMINTVTKSGFTPARVPQKFEAGTPMIVPAIGLGKAVEYLLGLGLANVRAHELALTRLAHELTAEIPGLRVLGPPPEQKGGVFSFVVEGTHPDDLSRILDLHGIAVRSGHHCAMPLHERLGISASCRASFYVYNTAGEVEQFAAALRKGTAMLRK
ncbi:MAG: SufS family cysteine desulfurase [Pirellulaceae bacterium]|nr:SufS family cysteine desulfurase [Pirellulaceae bacterium]